MKLFILINCLFLVVTSSAQKVLLKYPITFAKGNFHNNNKTFLSPLENNIAIAIYDSKKADYILTDENFKIISNFSLPKSQTSFAVGEVELLGSSDGNQRNVVNMVYKINKDYRNGFIKEKYTYQTETVDFENKKISISKFVELPAKEKYLLSFTDENQFYFLTVNDDINEIIFYSLNKNGTAERNSVPVSPVSSKKQDQLSNYLSELKYINAKKEPSVEIGYSPAKIIGGSDRFLLSVIGDDALRLIEIDKKTFKAIDKNIISIKGENVGVYKKLLFHLNLDTDNVTVAVADMDGNSLKTITIDEAGYSNIFNEVFFTKREYDVKKVEQVDNWKQFKKLLKKGDRGIIVRKTDYGYILLVGSRDPIVRGSAAFNTTGSAAGTFSTGAAYTKPYYYKSVTGVILLGEDFQPMNKKGEISQSEQLNDVYFNTASRLRTQFQFKGKEYIGYYDEGDDAYFIQSIKID